MFIKTKEFGIVKENDLLIIGFLHEDKHHYFQIQDSLDMIYDEQDIKLGMNFYYLEKNNQCFSCYGGLSKIILNSTHLFFYLDATGINKLKESKIEIELNLNQMDYNKLKNELLFLIQKHNIIFELQQ
jgi:hypothetical protein